MLLEIKQFIQHALPYLPFVSAAVVTNKELNVSAFISRVIETAIIGGIIMYANVQVLDAKFQALEKTIAKVEQKDNNLVRRLADDEKTINDIKVIVKGIQKDVEHHMTRSGK